MFDSVLPNRKYRAIIHQMRTGKGLRGGISLTKTKNRTKKADAQKKTASAKKKKQQRGKTSGTSSARPVLYTDVVLLLFITLCVLLLLGDLELAGSAGKGLRNIQMGLFGTCGYVFPFFLLWSAILIHINYKEKPGLTILKVLSAFIVLISACGILELISGNSSQVTMTLKDYYVYGGDGLGGGFFGGFFYTMLYPLIGIPGTYLVLIVLLLIGLEFARGRSLIKPIRERGLEMYEEAQSEREVRKEIRALKREEEELQRKERLKEIESKRAELHVKSLAFGEETKLEEDEITEQRIPEPKIAGGKKKQQSIPVSGPADRTEKHGIDPRDLPKRDKRTLAELESLDRKAEPEAELTGFAGRPLFTDITERETPAGSSFGRKSGTVQTPAAAPAEKEIQAPVFTEEPEVKFEPVIHMPAPAHPAEEEPDLEDSMAAYDDFAAAPVPTKEDIEKAGANREEPEPPAAKNTGRPTAHVSSNSHAGRTGSTGTRSGSANSGDIWRKGEARDGNSGVTFTAPVKPAEPEKPVVKREYVFPPLSLLKSADQSADISADSLKATALKLQQTLRDFGVGVTVTDISCGPSITRYELQPDQGVKVSRITSLADDIKLNLAASDIRIEAPIPGKAAVGIEVPNKTKQMVRFRELLESPEFKKSASRITFGVGKGISGDIIVTDLAKMPHLLIAGATGSGKSVCINTLIMSILYKAHPDDVKFIMVDPKMVELSVYNGILHLLIPVVTDAKMAAGALNWAVAEMTDRYQKFADYGVRDIKGYNKKAMEEEDPDHPKLPQIVIVVDEMADLMMVAAKEVEDAICRLAALARAAGIHLVLATQRPSADVITGLIKTNVQSRIALSVQSSIDSRIILDQSGAETLLGNGDMLFYPSSYPKPVRVQGAFLSDEEIAEVIQFLQDQTDDTPVSNKAIEQHMAATAKDAGTVGAGERDELFAQAGRFIIEKEKASIGNLQRAFRIGFNRAARIMDQLADYGVVSEDNGTKAREILMSMEQFGALLEELGES